MINNKKIIGVCLTKVNDRKYLNFVNRLHSLALNAGYKLMVFNSFFDFSAPDSSDFGAKSVYDIINYDIIDAVIVLYDSFYCKLTADDIINGAQSKDVPVIILNEASEKYESAEALARYSIDAAALAFNDKNAFMELKNKHESVISEACGCKNHTDDECCESVSELYSMIAEMENHEDFMYSWIERILEIKDMNSLYEILAGCIPENSYVCLNTTFVASVMDVDFKKQDNCFSDRLIVISPNYTNINSENTKKMTFSNIVPNLTEWAGDNTSYIVNSIYIGDIVCGYFAAATDSVTDSIHKIKRVLKVINIAFNVTIRRFKEMKHSHAENAALIDPITDMPNFKGAVKWFKEFSSNPHNHIMALTISVYSLPQYAYIYENFGVDAAEEAVRFVAESLKIANPAECYIAHITEDEFAIINYYTDSMAIGDIIYKATTVFYSIMEDYNKNSGKEYYVEVNCGCTVVDGDWRGSLESYIKFANSEMYMNRLKSAASSKVKDQPMSAAHTKMIEILIEQNLFLYHFQPIVDAATGDIYAYEALMRTDASIGMNPLEILDAARVSSRLYDVEKATIFNVMGRYAAERESFGNAKVFINTIPGYFINNKDIAELSEKYKGLMGNFIFELTEQDTVSDKELDAIRRLCGQTDSNQIAIDDYGTGHSNIVNLMRYAPQIIKIDRFLITNIHTDKNKQMFVRNTVEFAKLNNIKVLAEGVETSDELRTVIELGIDLIQGYYTGRPALEPIGAIAEEIRKEIIDAHNLKSN